MANKTMHHAIIGSDTYEIIDQQARADITETDTHILGLYPQVELASASIATFDDGTDGIPMKKVKVYIEPSQPNDYDSVWPGGGGKNLLQNTGTSQTINGVTFTVNADGIVTANGTATAQAILVIGDFTGTNGTQYIVNGAPSGSAFGTYFLSATVAADYGNGATFTGTGTSASVRVIVQSGQTVNNVVFKPMIRLSSVTDSTYTPYSNICPISGWTAVNTSVTGKNLLDPSTLRAGTINISNGEYISTTSRATFKSPIPVTDKLTVSINSTYRLGSGCVYDINGDFLASVTVDSWKEGSYTYTIPNGAYYLALVLKRADAANVNVSEINIQAEIGSTATTYAEYVGNQTYTTSLGQTVYGGTLDVVTGELVIDREYLELTADNWTVWNDTDKAAFTNALYSGRRVVMCNSLVADSSSLGGVYVRTADGRIKAVPQWAQSCSDLASFKIALANNPPINVVISLATTTTVQLTAQEVDSLLGDNVVWADAGNVEVTYRKGMEGVTVTDPNSDGHLVITIGGQ